MDIESLTVPSETFLILVVNPVKTRNLQHQGIPGNQQELLKYPFTPQGLWVISRRVTKGKLSNEWYSESGSGCMFEILGLWVSLS